MSQSWLIQVAMSQISAKRMSLVDDLIHTYVFNRIADHIADGFPLVCEAVKESVYEAAPPLE
jgi:hypothetical protein